MAKRQERLIKKELKKQTSVCVCERENREETQCRAAEGIGSAHCYEEKRKYEAGKRAVEQGHIIQHFEE